LLKNACIISPTLEAYGIYSLTKFVFDLNSIADILLSQHSLREILEANPPQGPYFTSTDDMHSLQMAACVNRLYEEVYIKNLSNPLESSWRLTVVALLVAFWQHFVSGIIWETVEAISAKEPTGLSKNVWKKLVKEQLNSFNTPNVGLVVTLFKKCLEIEINLESKKEHINKMVKWRHEAVHKGRKTTDTPIMDSDPVKDVREILEATIIISQKVLEVIQRQHQLIGTIPILEYGKEISSATIPQEIITHWEEHMFPVIVMTRILEDKFRKYITKDKDVHKKKKRKDVGPNLLYDPAGPPPVDDNNEKNDQMKARIDQVEMIREQLDCEGTKSERQQLHTALEKLTTEITDLTKDI